MQTLRFPIGATIASCLLVTSVEAQERQLFGGAVVGIATLSADARADITTTGADVSLYKPENGPALNLLIGVHVHEFVTLQANYIWNRNDLELVSARDGATGPAFYEQPLASSQHAIVGDVLLYFRNRESAIRPYLSVGAGALRLATSTGENGRSVNASPPGELRANRGLLRVAVGLDLAIGRGWSVRYSFSESISGNPITKQLSPQGQRGLANFQNLFGIVRAL